MFSTGQNVNLSQEVSVCKMVCNVGTRVPKDFTLAPLAPGNVTSGKRGKR